MGEKQEQYLPLFIKRLPVIGRMGESLIKFAGEFNSRTHFENIEEDFDRQQRQSDTAYGRLLGKRVLEKIKKGEPMDEFDKDGNIIGNTWQKFRSIPGDITYKTMGFTEDEIMMLDNKELFQPIAFVIDLREEANIDLIKIESEQQVPETR